MDPSIDATLFLPAVAMAAILRETVHVVIFLSASKGERDDDERENLALRATCENVRENE